MTPAKLARYGRQGATLAILALMVGACATPEPPKPAPPPPPPPVAAPEPPKPVIPPVPELTPAQAKAQAQKLTTDAVMQLQNGDEEGASRALAQALTLDPTNDLARKLTDQIKADPQKELGTTFFRYTVQRDDSLSKLAQQYLGDRFRFYILAKYNDIQVPNRLAAGQMIKIPGKTPTAVAPRPPAPSPEPTDDAIKATVGDTPAPRGASVALMQQGAALQRSGDLQGAYAAFSEAAVRDPGNQDAVLQRDSTRQALVQRYEREAATAFSHQNLDEDIQKWDQVLALDPGNQKAQLERERALDLKKKMSEKFGAKQN